MYRYIMERTQISLTPEERRWLDAETARTGRSMSALIREAIDQVYGPKRDSEADLAALESALGAWAGREGGEVDGVDYVERLRSGSRLAAEAQ